MVTLIMLHIEGIMETNKMQKLIHLFYKIIAFLKKKRKLLNQAP